MFEIDKSTVIELRLVVARSCGKGESGATA